MRVLFVLGFGFQLRWIYIVWSDPCFVTTVAHINDVVPFALGFFVNHKNARNDLSSVSNFEANKIANFCICLFGFAWTCTSIVHIFQLHKRFPNGTCFGVAMKLNIAKQLRRANIHSKLTRSDEGFLRKSCVISTSIKTGGMLFLATGSDFTCTCDRELSCSDLVPSVVRFFGSVRAENTLWFKHQILEHHIPHLLKKC